MAPRVCRVARVFVVNKAPITPRGPSNLSVPRAPWAPRVPMDLRVPMGC